MPYTVEINLVGNNLHLASFYLPCGQYYWLLDDLTRIVFSYVQYAWCHRCERFVEVERLPTVEEVDTRISELETNRHCWERLDEETEDRFQSLGHEMRSELRMAEQHRTWRAAKEWITTRKSPPRCLECGSFFAIAIIPFNEEVPHPDGRGKVIVRGGDHVNCAAFPDPVYFDREGTRLTIKPLTWAGR